MSKVNLISSWSRPGGGTIAHIALTNLLNDNGVDCTFYGPHDWHMDKCRGALLKDAVWEADDILISHFIQIPPGFQCKKHILYCHEKDLFPLKKIDLRQYDTIAFVSNSQKQWHSVNHPSVIIPPAVDKLSWKDPNNKVAGVIGSVDTNKQVHLSIARAFKDGYDTVLLFGDVTDMPYFDKEVSPLMNSNSRIRLAGHQDDREKMYGQISAVYHSSLSETYGLVEAECKLAGIPFNGPSNNQDIVEKDEIFTRWKKCLDL
tara:strand:+ start:1250 stop:2029 length:780 start_codon:yes stop_codon:yes gene_type:complete